MATIKNYFGKLIGWNQTTINILGRDVVGTDEFEYSDSTKKENAYGAGGYPVGSTEGNYEAKFSLSSNSGRIFIITYLRKYTQFFHNLRIN